MDQAEIHNVDEPLETGPSAVSNRHAQHALLVEAVRKHLLARDVEFARYGAESPECGYDGLANYYFAVEDEPHLPAAVFPLMRWGGVFVYVSRDAGRIKELSDQFGQRGFEVLEPHGLIGRSFRFLGLKIPLPGEKIHYFVARKVNLILPREISDRFTYSVRLVRRSFGADEYVVQKEVPSMKRVVERLQTKFPTVPIDVIEKRARKFTDKIFPLFLTREAAILKILERDLPDPYRHLVPRVYDIEKDERGYVKTLRMRWLRNGGRPISQLEFARQSADLLRALHDDAGIIHLDLRLDNFVITERGVGFVDFGSSVRVGENMKDNPLLDTIFEDLMRTSQIQRMLERMTLAGSVTSPVINKGYHKVDKAVDLFYLALQMSQPLGNPDLSDLILYDHQSDDARALADLTREVLKPADPNNPPYKSAKDVLDGINRIADGHGHLVPAGI